MTCLRAVGTSRGGVALVAHTLALECTYRWTYMYACYVWNGDTTALAYTHTHTGRAAYAGDWDVVLVVAALNALHAGAQGLKVGSPGECGHPQTWLACKRPARYKLAVEFCGLGCTRPLFQTTHAPTRVEKRNIAYAHG